MGLSVEVEDEVFVNTKRADGDPGSTTMAEAEASLVHSILHTLVGSAVADETAERFGWHEGQPVRLRRQGGPNGLLGDLVRSLYRCHS